MALKPANGTSSNNSLYLHKYSSTTLAEHKNVSLGLGIQKFRSDRKNILNPLS